MNLSQSLIIKINKMIFHKNYFKNYDNYFSFSIATPNIALTKSRPFFFKSIKVNKLTSVFLTFKKLIKWFLIEFYKNKMVLGFYNIVILIPGHDQYLVLNKCNQVIKTVFLSTFQKGQHYPKSIDTLNDNQYFLNY